MYPDDCLQSVIGTPSEWWITNDHYELCRGALIFAFIPHVDQTPYSFEPVGRNEPARHDSAIVRVTPLKVGQPLRQTNLPVAAMTLHTGEVWVASRAKVRPCLVLGSTDYPRVSKSLVTGMPRTSTAPTILVAPYYGVDKDGTRSGYNPRFIERVRHCEYPQFMWDRLPMKGGPQESILRVDQLQPIGAHYHSHRVSEFKLSADALAVMDELLLYVMFGGVPKRGHVASFRELIEETFDSETKVLR